MTLYRNNTDRVRPLRRGDYRVEVAPGGTVELSAEHLKDGQTRNRVQRFFTRVEDVDSTVIADAEEVDDGDA